MQRGKEPSSPPVPSYPSKLLVVGLLLPALVAGSLAPQPGQATAATSPGTESRSSSPSTPPSFTELAEKLAPSVVNIKITRVERAGFHGMPFQGSPFDDFFGPFSGGGPRPPGPRRVEGAGSGVLIRSDGYILTNNHVVEKAREVTVTLSDQKEYKARVVGRDPKTDLAVLKIEGKEPFPSAVMGDSDALKVGEWVLAVGNPFGLGRTVTSGIVSAKGRVIGAGPYDDFIQTDASINPGNSGGPLFNLQGELVGINTAIIADGQGIGFAIPVNMAKTLVPQLISHGEATRGHLGVTIQPVTEDLAAALNLPDPKGALVGDVTRGSPADKAGIKRGDVILEYDGKPVKDSRQLPAMVAATPVGEKATVGVLRNGKELTLEAKIAGSPSQTARETDAEEPAQGKWGLMLRELTPDLAQRHGIVGDRGVLVVQVKPGSPAEEASIRPRDILLEVDRHPVSSPEDVKERLNGGKSPDRHLVLIQRGENTLFAVLKG
ncbi:MAG TPA: DegQ family serine endoprotease [Syntrophobacteraceae bacterium]|nr:DegQ family serine endoprotease [Syntrophobacteraceae bacterium]